MPTFQKCDKKVAAMAASILEQFDTHHPVRDAGVTVDYVFAFSDKDEASRKPLNIALSKNGVQALGICRKIPLKDRALGRADAEISIDGDWWKEAPDEERRALLDHELHHIAVKVDKRGLVRDDLGRPILQMRKHDYEFGWFKCIAARHGVHSMERIYAQAIMCDAGQYFWPDLVTAVEAQSGRMSKLEMSNRIAA